MKIVFIKDIAKIAKKNEIKDVADGYARFLISSGSAVAATPEILNKVKQLETHKLGLKQKTAAEFKALADMLSGKKFIIAAKVSNGKNLFGGVHEEDIKRVIQKELNISVNPKSIKIQKTIKELGVYTVAISEGTMHTQFEIEVVPLA
ncbi:MAG: ribosomal protein [Candidatus Parcubacteria bacterium]|jgi:large subunit ribosomal protein L9